MSRLIIEEAVQFKKINTILKEMSQYNTRMTGSAELKINKSEKTTPNHRCICRADENYFDSKSIRNR